MVNACRHNGVRYLVFTSSQVNMARGGFYVRLGNGESKCPHRCAGIYTCADYTFNSEKAIKDFGFKPKYSPEEALERTIGYYKLQKMK